MTPATTAMVIRVLKLREATDRAALAAAQLEQARCTVAAAAMAAAIAREHAFVEASAAQQPGLAFGPWRAAAAADLADRHRAAANAEAACEGPHQALTDTIRLRRGFATLCERAAEAAERDAQRRDSFQHLMLLPASHRDPG